MKKIVKILSAVMALVLCLSLFSACGSEKVTAKVIEIDLTNEEYAFGVDKTQPELLKEVNDFIAEIKENYHYIIIDCPPSLGMLTVNALSAADGVIVPMQCEYFALEGLSQMLMTIKQIKKLYNPSLSLTGILITMYNGRLNLSIQVMEELKAHYEDKLFSVTIPRSVRLSEAPSYGTPIQYYDKRNKGAIHYGKIAKEIMDRI